MHSCVRGDEFILQEMESCILRAVARVANMSAAAVICFCFFFLQRGAPWVCYLAGVVNRTLRGISVKAAADQH